MIPRIIYFFILPFCSASYAGPMLQSTISSYSSWKMTQEGYKKDCDKDSEKLSAATLDPKTMLGATQRNLRQTYIPTTIIYKSKLDSDTKNKLDAIDAAAKTKALEVLKVSKKLPVELAQKSTGLGLTTDAQLTPSDFLKKFDYKKSCECLRNTQNVARDEAEYNKLTVEEFMVREEQNRVKCFVQNATL